MEPHRTRSILPSSFDRLRRAPSRISVRFFSSASDAPRARRPTDIVLLVLSIITLAFASFVWPHTGGFGAAMDSFVAALPGLLGGFWEACDVLLVAWAATLLLVSVFARGRKALLRDQLIALFLAFAGSELLLKDGVSLGDALTRNGPPQVYPAVRIAVCAAVLATNSPHLGRPVRRIGRWLVPLASLAAVALGASRVIGVVAAIALGYGCAAVVHLLFGSPGGRPTPEQVSESLSQLGIETERLEPAKLEPRGVALLWATTTSGDSLLVKVYGRDAWDGQLITTTWTYLWYRDERPNLTVSRLQQVEHEAFLTLLAERAGVPVAPVVAAGMAGDDALLVTEPRGTMLSAADADEITDGVISKLWQAVIRMHDAGIAHQNLDADHIAVQADGIALIGGFAGASAGATARELLSDRAQLLVTTALAVGHDRAVAAALAALGKDDLIQTLPFVQTANMTGGTRKALKAARFDLDDLRKQAAAAGDTKPPQLEPLRRVTWKRALVTAFIVLIAYGLISRIADVGLQAIVDQLQGADGWWILAAFLLAPVANLAQAFSTIGASLYPLELGPVILLQFAIQFIQLAVPSSAARIAMSVRFFQRSGAPAAAALMIGVVDGVSGFVVQVSLLLVIMLADLASLNLSLDIDVDSTVVIVVVVVGAALVGGLLLIPRIRRLVQPRMAEAREALKVLKRPTKVAQLFGGNLAGQIILAIVLGLCLRAFGYRASFAELILINTFTSLFAGFMPIPGGIGVAEAALSAGLVAIGVPNSAAVSTALTYRLVTYYLPPIWGAYAVRVLRKHEFL